MRAGSRDDGEMVTEGSLNRGLSLEAADVLVVCSKLETGYDEPKLVAMYVDRALHGAHAVQVLGRLNRHCEGKPPPSVVDFVNSAMMIKHSFERFYEATQHWGSGDSQHMMVDFELDAHLANILVHLGSLRGAPLSEVVSRLSRLDANICESVEASLRGYASLARSSQRQQRELPLVWVERLLEMLGAVADGKESALRLGGAGEEAGAS